MIIVYGITNCSTVQKARTWLQTRGIDYTFHDYKKIGIDADHLKVWCEKFGWEKVLNRQGMMWKKATDQEKRQVTDMASAIDFMIRVPSSIKRPVIEYENGLLLGFDENEYERCLV